MHLFKQLPKVNRRIATGQSNRTIIALDPPDEEMALRVAKNIAERTGRAVIVTDMQGHEICTVLGGFKLHS